MKPGSLLQAIGYINTLPFLNDSNCLLPERPKTPTI